MGLLTTVTFENSLTMAPEDRVVNTFAVKTQGDQHTQGKLEALGAAFANFYNAVPTGRPSSVGSFLSSVLSRGANHMVIRFYDITNHLDGSPAGSPIQDYITALTAAQAGDSMPTEVAMCATIESVGRGEAPVESPDGPDADLKVDRPRQRNTGRIYLGPFLRAAAVEQTNYNRPNAAFRQTVRQAFKDLAVAVGNIPDAPAVWDLGVWSRKDAIIRAAGFISIDDAWDTQRRRGQAPTIREREAL